MSQTHNERFLVEEALERCPKNPKETLNVILAPLEISTSYVKGTASGPQEIINASHQIEDYDLQLDTVPVVDYAIETDRSLVGPLMKCNAAAQMDEAIGLLSDRTVQALGAGQVPLFLGGEHTVSLGVLRGFRKFSDTPITVVQTDAHCDLRSSYDGRDFAHGTVFYHVSKFYPVRQVGIRVMSEEEREFLASSKQVVCFPMHEIREKERAAKREKAVWPPKWIDQVIASIPTKHVYLSVDVDGFDPRLMPATGTPVPGGLDWDESLEFFARLFREKQVVGADFVELAPQPGLHGASFLTAMLIYKLMAFGFKKLG
jgi:agmatinase